MNDVSKKGIPLWGSAVIMIIVLTLAFAGITWVFSSAYSGASNEVLQESIQQRERVLDGEEPCPFCGHMFEKATEE